MNITRKILFVSDDIILCRKVESRFEDDNRFDLLAATNDYEHAIYLTKKNMPTLILVDVNLAKEGVSTDYILELKSMLRDKKFRCTSRILALCNSIEQKNFCNRNFIDFMQKPTESVPDEILSVVRSVIVNIEYNPMVLRSDYDEESSHGRLAMEDWMQSLFVKLGVYEKIGAVYLTHAVPKLVEQWTNNLTFKLNDVYVIIEDHFNVGNRKTIETAMRTLIRVINTADFNKFNALYSDLLQTNFILTPKRLVFCFYNLLRKEFIGKY